MDKATQTTAELHEAEAALHQSLNAIQTHGHQGMTWALLRADAARVRKLRAAIAKAEGSAAPETLSHHD